MSPSFSAGALHDAYIGSGIPSAPDNVNSQCCDAKMGLSTIAYPTCPAYQNGDVAVARYPAIEINSGNVSHFA
jgi:hypothetical protein